MSKKKAEETSCNRLCHLELQRKAEVTSTFQPRVRIPPLGPRARNDNRQLKQSGVNKKLLEKLVIRGFLAIMWA